MIKQSSLEDRLAALESAGAALAATSEAFAIQMTSLMQQTSNIAAQQKVLEIKLHQGLEKTNSTGNEKRNNEELKEVLSFPVVRHECVNLEQRYDELQPHISHYDFFDNFKNLYQYETATMNLIFKLETPFKVNKATHLPPVDYYVNRSIKYIDELIFAIKTGRSLPNYQSCVHKIISELNTFQKYNISYNGNSLDRKTALKWADVIEREAPTKVYNNNVVQLDIGVKQQKNNKPHIKNVEERLRKGEYDNNNLDKAKEVEQDKNEPQIKNDEERNKKDEQPNNIVKQAYEMKQFQMKKDVEKLLKESTNARNPQQSQGYINWDETHDVLETHSYVNLRVLYDKIRIWKSYTTTPSVPEQLSFQQKIYYSFGSSSRIEKTTRFPAHGLCLNVNLPAIQFLLETVLNGKFFNQEEYHSEVNKLLDSIFNIVMNEKDGIYNRVTFEDKYKLKWVEKAE